ncbi:PIN domain protein [Desulfamplus magnetovallimortis]|uniref:Ribonuclease VapC n=1 Tax=Desulfamplus magnetovallimortis TaxID=1246637 RepID=A0A1W1H7Y1_9BACT|nr:type II toxin-antitoxin system VapC family toxin [Desulfamplus magnetovallimortis]SLM28579.1 PIN domain protein [Desulfamplus magnetovallimortis]
MIICDTNILIEFYKNTPKIIQELQAIGCKRIAISAITQAELYFGAFDKVELRKIKEHLSLMTVLPLTNNISDRFLELMEIYCLSHKLSLPDALIAATSLIHKYELYTLNQKDFRFIQEMLLYQPITYISI